MNLLGGEWEGFEKILWEASVVLGFEKEQDMRLMITYLNPDGDPMIVEKDLDNHKLTLGMVAPGCTAIMSVVEVPEGMDYDKVLYGQSVSMHPHAYALMVTKASSNELAVDNMGLDRRASS